MSELRRGMLLVASPTLLDPNFFRAVVLMMEIDDDGAVGIVLDRPLDVDVDDHVPNWHSHLAPPARVFQGGPVRPEIAIGVARRPGVETSEDWRPIEGAVGFIDVSHDPDDVPGVEELRIFAGYAGWGPGQLEGELGGGSWFPVPSSVDDVFDPVPTTLWRRVLRRQDWSIARYANYPVDVRSN